MPAQAQQHQLPVRLEAQRQRVGPDAATRRIAAGIGIHTAIVQNLGNCARHGTGRRHVGPVKIRGQPLMGHQKLTTMVSMSTYAATAKTR
jgi:hypothetical protein